VIELNFGGFPIKAWTDEIEDEAVKQLENIATLPFIHSHIACMPDVHFGIGATVGSVIATVGAVIPAAVGVDIGCGMLAVPTNLTAEDMPDDLSKIRHSIEREIPTGFNAYQDGDHLEEHEYRILENDAVTDLLRRHKINSGRQSPVQQIGTLGGGNHFIEVCLDHRNDVWLMLHSGSRGIGNKIGTAFIELAKGEMERQGITLPDKNLAYLNEGSDHFGDYVAAVGWAQLYAANNRRVMLRRLIRTLTHHFPKLIVDVENRVINCHHNYISKEFHFGKDVMVTRKGAVRAGLGERGIIPGSMGTRSYIVEGLGNPESFSSCSHGAGRRMSRTAARKTFTLQDHERDTEGVECRRDLAVLDETPGAYKDIDVVMANQRDLVNPIHTLKQIICVKG